MSFFSKLLDFGLKALEVYAQTNNQQVQNDEHNNEDKTEETEEEEYDEESMDEELSHNFFILNKYIESIPKIHLNKLIEQLEYAKYDHSPYSKQNRENRKRWYRQIRQTINKFAVPYHRQKAQAAYSAICDAFELQELPSYELSYIFRHNSNLCNDIRDACDLSKPQDISKTSNRQALVVILNLVSYDELY